MSGSTPERPPHRFHRALTGPELEAVFSACLEGGVDRGMPVLWDILLQEAEGTTWADATTAGRRFEPGDYAIPSSQATAVKAALGQYHGLGGSGHPSVLMLWLSIGPATY